MPDKPGPEKTGRVFVIGLDGGTFTRLDPMMAEGRMPNLERIVKGGTRGVLRTVVPPVTPAAWSSFMTGKNPGKHGVLEFILKDGDGESPVNSRLRRGKTIFRLVNDFGGKVVSMSVPTTYPPERVDGCMISGFLTPVGNTDYGWPYELIDEIEDVFGKYRLYVREVYVPGRVPHVIADAEEDVRYKFEVARWLMEKIDWKLFMLHLYGTDRIQHELWHLTDPNSPLYSEKESRLYLDGFYEFYGKLDRELGTVLDRLGPDDTLFIMSDHGFGPVYRFLNFNTWLLEKGYIKLKRGVMTRFRKALFDLGFVPKNAYRLFMRLGLARYRLTLGVSNRKSIFRWVNKFFLSFNDIDWTRTTAYSRGYYGQIYVNLEGRQPRGIVSADEYETVCRRIIEDLRGITDTEKGNPIIGPVYRPVDLYDGPFAKNAPDITFLPADMSYKAIGTADFTSNRFFEPIYANSGDHRLDGIFIANGPGVRKGHTIDSAWIGDMAPTILHALGLPVPDDMDGRVIEGAYTGEWLERRPIRFVEATDDDVDEDDESGYTDEEKDAIRDMLKGLDYI